MQEKRSIDRIRCYYYLKIYDKNSKTDVGSVIDISTKGLRVISDNEFKSKTPFEFTIKLPKGYILGDAFDINAKCRWCSKQNNENFYEAGFEFINADKKGVIYVKTLINDFKNHNLL